MRAPVFVRGKSEENKWNTVQKPVGNRLSVVVKIPAVW